MKRKPSRRGRARKPVKKKAAPGKRRRSRPILSEPAIARATAAAEASIKAELVEHPAVGGEDLAEEALAEALELGMLLDEEPPESGEEGETADGEEYFLKPAAQNPASPRGRPAPEIVTRDAARAAPEARDATAHLFPRSFRVDYPVAVRAKGIWIHDSGGRAYIDGSGGALVCSIGHGVEQVTRVMSAQAARLAFTHSSQFVSREAMGLCDRLAALAPGDMKRTGRVYLVSGGSEAVETALKMARQYHVDTGRPAKSKIIARWQSYHGSTLGALAATGNVARREIYTPLFAATPHIAPCYCYRCPYGLKLPSCRIACVEDLEAVIHQEGPDTVAAFIAEPIVGATLGAVPAVEGYWRRAREICSKYGVLLIADEVMTGLGRTGKNFAVDHHRVVPDLLVVGKGLSGGYTPLGAVIARGAVADGIRGGHGHFEHGFTYSANPLSAAVGSAVLDYIVDNRLIARAARMGRVLGTRLAALRRHRIVGDVRGAGMMWGVELVRNRATREPFPAPLRLSRLVYDACLEQGLIIYPGSGSREGQDGDHFMVGPPFTVTRAEIDELVARLDRALVKIVRSLR